MTDQSIEMTINPSILPKKESDKSNIFFEELRRWKEGLINDDIEVLSDVIFNGKVVRSGAYQKSLEIESTLNVNEEDKDLFAIGSNLMGVMVELTESKWKMKEVDKRSNLSLEEKNKEKQRIRGKLKTDSVQMQQDAVREVLRRFEGDKFNDNKVTEYFLALDQVMEHLSKKLAFSEKNEGNISEYIIYSGLRGMISAALIFRMNGFEVKIPSEDWDKYHDIDLLVERGTEKYSLSVKSHDMGLYLENIEPPKDMNRQQYGDIYTHHLRIYIPNKKSAYGLGYCDSKIDGGLEMGLPSKSSVSEINNRLKAIVTI